MGARLIFTLGSILLTGCTARNADFQPLPDHPANPAAAEAPLPPPSETLALAPTAGEGTSADEPKGAAAELGHTSHQHGEHAGHGGGPDATPAKSSADAGHAHHRSVSSVDGHAATTTSSVPVDAAATKTIYVCPMHKQVQSDKPGKCPICKMKLKPKQVPAGTAPTIRPTSSPSVTQDGGAGHAHHEHGGNK